MVVVVVVVGGVGFEVGGSPHPMQEHVQLSHEMQLPHVTHEAVQSVVQSSVAVATGPWAET